MGFAHDGWTDLDDVCPHDLALSSAALDTLARSAPAQEPMRDLFIRRKNLLHFESLHVPPQERGDRRHVCLGHFAPSGREGCRREGVFADEA